MKAIRISIINKLNTRKLRSRLNHRATATMLVLFLLANVAVSFGRAAVTIKNDGNLFAMLDDFDINRLSGLLDESSSGEIHENAANLIQKQNKKSVVVNVNAKKLDTETTNKKNNSAEDIDHDHIMDFGEVINLIKSKSDNSAISNFNAIYLELLRKLHKTLLREKISTTAAAAGPATTLTTSTSTSTSSTSTSTANTITISKLKLQLKNYFENFMHLSLAENLQKLLRLVAEDEEEGEGKGNKMSEKNVKLKAEKNNSKTLPDVVPLSKKTEPEVSVSESASVKKLKGRKLGINIPLIRVKVDDKVLFQGKAEVKLHLDELNPLTWALVIFTVLLFITIILGIIFGRTYLRKIDDIQYEDFQNQNQNQLKELHLMHSRGCTSRSVSVRDRERRSSRVPPACRCGCEDDITKTHISDIIHEDYDHDSGTSSHMGGSSIV